MKLEELKTAIENASSFRFETDRDIIEREVLRLVGLPKKCEITLHISRYTAGDPFVAVDGKDRRSGYSGFAFPCDTTEEVIDRLKRKATHYGWEEPAQLSMF